MAEEIFLTLPQVAELLHVSARTVFNMTRDGRLPARRLPGTRKYLYVREEIVDLVNQHRTDAPVADEPALDEDAELTPATRRRRRDAE